MHIIINLSVFYYENELIINAVTKLLGYISSSVFVIWTFIKFIYKQKLRIEAHFTMSQGVINKLNSFTEIILINNKDCNVPINAIDLVVYDKFNKYTLNLSDKNYVLKAHSNETINISPISCLVLNEKFIDISYLVLEKRQFCFILKPKNYVISVKKFPLLWWKKNNIIKPYRFTYKGVIHSPDWEYGFTYSKNNVQGVGFFNKDAIHCADIKFNQERTGDYSFTLDFTLAFLKANNFEILDIKKLDSYQIIIPEILGKKDINKNLENILTITDNEILSMEINE